MAEYGVRPEWRPERPRFSLVGFLVSWLLLTVSLLVAAAIVPNVSIPDLGDALVVALFVGALTAVLPPLVAALRLPYTLIVDFVLVLVLDALILVVASHLDSSAIHVAGFGWALLMALVTSAVTVVLEAVLGVNRSQVYALRVIQRVAKRADDRVETDAPGIIFLEIDGLALPVLQRAMRDGNAPVLARWAAEGTHRLLEWETDLSSQTGASQAGILLGANDDIPAFRWVEKETARLVACSGPADCAEIEHRLSTGKGLLANGGASRGNLLSGDADHTILTVSRIEAEKGANPGYRTFFANGYNVVRTLVLVLWEVMLELTAAARQRRRDVRPRGHRGGIYPLLRAAVCVFARDLIVYGVVTDMMKGRPAMYATFSGYDEVAHHSGLERPDTLEALRKLDEQFGRIDAARRFAPRPYEIVVLSDHGQTQGATFKQRNGHGLDELVRRSLSGGGVAAMASGDENASTVDSALVEATGKRAKKDKNDVSGESVVVLGSGNLGLVYLMDEPRRLTVEEIEERHPDLVRALRSHPHVGWLLVRSAERGPLVLGARGSRELATGCVQGEDPLAPFGANAPTHILRSDSFAHVPDILVGSFYDPVLQDACAFEELISFHGGLGGPQTRPFIFAPVDLPGPAGPLVGAVSVHTLLSGWRALLNGAGEEKREPEAARAAGVPAWR